jgi:undecaprenyl-diphosphatase
MSTVPARSRGSLLPAIAAAVLFLLLAVLARTGTTDAFDSAVIDLVRAPELHDLLAPLRWITELGSTWAVIVLAAVALLVGWVAGLGRDGAAAGLAIGVGSLAIEILKRILTRTRPDLLEPVIVEAGFSFPSGHAANGMVAYGVLAVLVGRLPLARPVRLAVQIGAGLVIFLVGLSRVWLGVHYPTDVLAGWALGAVIVVLYAALTRRAPPGRASGAAVAGRAAPRSDPPAAG